MAKNNVIAEFVRYDCTHEEGLRIYYNKNGLRGTLLNSYAKKITSKFFRTKQIWKVKEYFGFTDDNSYQTKIY